MEKTLYLFITPELYNSILRSEQTCGKQILYIILTNSCFYAICHFERRHIYDGPIVYALRKTIRLKNNKKII